jgi:ethanolamine permease
VAQERKVGSVTYREVGGDYFEKRGLRRHAAFWSLWSLGVAAVISGDFYGWNFGLDSGGFGGLLIATLVIMVMYYGLCYSIAEMSPALPHTGGAYSFAVPRWGRGADSSPASPRTWSTSSPRRWWWAPSAC